MLYQQSELDSATERFLIDDVAATDAAPAPPPEVLAVLTDAAGHVADALPELLILGRGGNRFAERARPYLDEITHCLAAALEAVLTASKDVEAAGIGAARKGGEAALAIVARDYLNQSAA